MRKQHDQVRFNIDMPIEQHKYIKMLAAQNGISMRDLVVNILPSPQANTGEMLPNVDEVLSGILNKYRKQLNNLAKR